MHPDGAWNLVVRRPEKPSASGASEGAVTGARASGQGWSQTAATNGQVIWILKLLMTINNDGQASAITVLSEHFALSLITTLTAQYHALPFLQMRKLRLRQAN